MTWTVEAFRVSDEGLEWDLDLGGAGRADLESALGIDKLDVPGSVPITEAQAKVLLRVIANIDPGMYLGGSGELRYFLTEYAD
ncbi:hypothetical protein ABT337_15170 [Saccharopolyspora hirsuta]|uniref:Uncharacterized protein n=1 Tax=Saccharopolyspora hirsuta TaxID=1837 RepID=A0A5M7C4G3_SACHI|nr:hypothetical protein [Saccharopolyspora hirsuta]KAA5837266.1 hypothetical protein F1721_05575 [Saccharopolyspora hirsuta]